MSIQFVWCNSLSETLFPAQDYSKLLELIPESTPFNHMAWLQGAEQSLKAKQQLKILLGYDNNELVICLPLILCAEKALGLPIKTLRHLGYPLSDRIALGVKANTDNFLGQALQEIRQKLSFSLIQFSEITEQSAQASGLKQWQQQFWYSEDRLSCAVPVHQITEADRIEPSGNIRYKLRKARKRANELPAHIERVALTSENVLEIIADISEVERLSWKGDDGVGVFSGEQRMKWMTTALTGFAETDNLRVLTMRHNDRCISYRLGFLDKGRIYDYNLAFLPDYASLGSGRLLLDEWIQWGLDENWQYIDASRVSLQDSSHQLHERCTEFIEHRRWTFYSMRPAGLFLGLSYKVWQFIKPLLQSKRLTKKGTKDE